MRILYSYLIGCLLLSSLVALGQDLQSLPDVPTVKSSKATEPFLGVAVNIPLVKLFGKKRVKALLEAPTADSLLATAPILEITKIPKPKFEVPTNNPYEAPIQTTISHFDLPPLHEESCFQSYLVTTYEDGHEDWDPIGAPWCVDASLQQSDDPTRISGGSDGNPNPVEPPHANDCEISYLAEMAFEGRNPLHAAVCMLLNASDVVDRIFDRFPNFTDQDSEPLNAVKHAMFIAFNACDFGDFDAGNMATLHENCGGIPPARAQSAAMDLFNNNVGLAIQAQIGCANRDNLAEEIFNAFRTGRLHKINGQPTP